MEKGIYKVALVLTLTDLSTEDMREHGRLLVLKEKLISMVDPNSELDIKTLGLFQLKDFCQTDMDTAATDASNI